MPARRTHRVRVWASGVNSEEKLQEDDKWVRFYGPEGPFLFFFFAESFAGRIKRFGVFLIARLLSKALEENEVSSFFSSHNFNSGIPWPAWLGMCSPKKNSCQLVQKVNFPKINLVRRGKHSVPITEIPSTPNFR